MPRAPMGPVARICVAGSSASWLGRQQTRYMCGFQHSKMAILVRTEISANALRRALEEMPGDSNEVP